jgi:hypothetical protein
MDDHICPITLEPIAVYGITCVGSLYEYDAISDWLQDHDTDPVTNLLLPTCFVVKFMDTPAAATKKGVDMRESLMGWCPSIRLILDNGIKKLHDHLYDLRTSVIDNPDFVQFASSFSLDEYANTGKDRAYMSRLKGKLWPENRPLDTGYGLQFLHFKNVTLSGKSFKSELFDFAVFENCTFISCQFGRASFTGTTFINTLFKKCTIAYGEESMFYKATGNIKISGTIRCEFYDWKGATSFEEVEKIFKQRFFEGIVSVV